MQNQIEVTGPAALIAALPYLLGFRPVDSVVVVLLDDSQVQAVLRFDLDSSISDLIPSILSGLSKHPSSSVVLVVVNSDLKLDVSNLEFALREQQVELLDLVLTDLVRYRSALCSDLHCCPIDGLEVSQQDADAISAQLVYSGHTVFSSRTQMLSRLNPNPDTKPVELALLEINSLLDLNELLNLLNSSGRTGLTATEMAQVALSISDADIRNDLEHELFDSVSGHLTNPDRLRCAIENLLQVARNTPLKVGAMSYGLLAFALWNLGDCVSAEAAAGYALKVEPFNSPAKLTLNLIQLGVHPVMARKTVFKSAA